MWVLIEPYASCPALWQATLTVKIAGGRKRMEYRYLVDPDGFDRNTIIDNERLQNRTKATDGRTRWLPEPTMAGRALCGTGSNLLSRSFHAGRYPPGTDYGATIAMCRAQRATSCFG